MEDLVSQDQRKIYPLKRLEDGDRFPRGGEVVLHGESDTVVPIGGSKMLRDKIQNLDPELDLRLVIRGGEHGSDHKADIKDDWLVEAFQGMTKAWIA
ncbi:hypothetical protein H9L39_20276 [Fusarium oxysporum f. sp. albedinis]|nr:hypothetical protein H9L39_20276 [Fusarium oxysporum f. sp. albedinis]